MKARPRDGRRTSTLETPATAEAKELAPEIREVVWVVAEILSTSEGGRLINAKRDSPESSPETRRMQARPHDVSTHG